MSTDNRTESAIARRNIIRTKAVLNFYSLENMNKLERIQKQALRFVYNNYSSSYEELLNKANRPTLYVQRLRSILSIVYKSLMKQGPIYVHDLFVINEHSRSKRYFPLVQPQFKTQRFVFNSFSYIASHHWNLLDNCYKDPSALANWQPLCSCATCDICILRKV